MTVRALIDTGPLVALYHPLDPHFPRCRAALAGFYPSLFTCVPVLTEAAWLLRKRPGGFQSIVQAFHTGLFRLLPITDVDLPGITEIIHRYEDAGIQFADASLAYLAEREGIRTVFTTDRRDFSIIRLKHNRTL